MAATPDDAWDRPAPCEGWTARDVVEHVTTSQRNLTAALTGAEPGDAPSDPKALWDQSYGAFRAAVEAGPLDKPVPGPFGEMPAETVIGRFLATDVLVHTWDLARAVGGDERIDADAVSQAFKGLQPMDAMIRQPGVFGPKVEPAPDADEQEQFLNFLGRVTRP